MDLLNQIQVPYDATALCMLEKIQSQPMCLKDFTRENCLKLRTIIKATTHEEVRTAAVHVQAFVKKQFELQRHSLRQKTLVELGQRYPTIRPQVHMLENAFYHAFTSSTSEFAVKSDIYLARCTDVIGSMRSKFALLATDAPVESIKDLVASALSSTPTRVVPSSNGCASSTDASDTEDELCSTVAQEGSSRLSPFVPESLPNSGGDMEACIISKKMQPEAVVTPDLGVTSLDLEFNSTPTKSDIYMKELQREAEDKMRAKKKRSRESLESDGSCDVYEEQPINRLSSLTSLEVVTAHEVATGQSVPLVPCPWSAGCYEGPSRLERATKFHRIARSFNWHNYV
eukprot:GEMP01052559.1.p1 GENE.GEMP01052559.1~~GEMP01052559.1.p1  ORF type:complete len:343 (+),score=49.88 GEMP01052559.1:213-1241(+)